MARPTHTVVLARRKSRIGGALSSSVSALLTPLACLAVAQGSWAPAPPIVPTASSEIPKGHPPPTPNPPLPSCSLSSAPPTPPAQRGGHSSGQESSRRSPGVVAAPCARPPGLCLAPIRVAADLPSARPVGAQPLGHLLPPDGLLTTCLPPPASQPALVGCRCAGLHGGHPERPGTARAARGSAGAAPAGAVGRPRWQQHFSCLRWWFLCRFAQLLCRRMAPLTIDIDQACLD